MEDSNRHDPGSAKQTDSLGWNRSSEGGSTATAIVEDVALASGLWDEKPRSERKRSRSEPALLREDLVREIGRIHAVVVIGEHSWGGGVFDGLACRPLLELAGRPLIVHMLEWLRRQGIRSAAICANGQTALVRECLGDGRKVGLSLQYYTDVMPRGPAGCIRDAAIDSGADTILAVSGMVVPRIALVDPYRQHHQTAAWVTVISCPGGGSSLEPSGMYLFSSRVLERIAPTGYQDIKETLLPQLRRDGGRVVLSTTREGEVLRIADLDTYMRANREVLESSLGEKWGAEYEQSGPVRVHRTADIHPTACLVGPVFVGPGCRIGPEVIVVGPSTIGMGCEIGRGAAISRSVIWPLSCIGERAVVESCVLGQGTYLDPGREVRNTFWTRCPRSGRSTFVPGSATGAARRLAS